MSISCDSDNLIRMADGDVSVDADERRRPHGRRVREVGERNDEDDDDRVAVLLVDTRFQSEELHCRLDTVQRKRRHQQ